MDIEYIKDLKATLDMLKQCGGSVVIFPSGGIGNALVDFLYYTGRAGQVACIASEKMRFNRFNRFTRTMPIIPLRVMPQFREEHPFLVAAPSDGVEEIHKMLIDFGCKHVFVLSDDVHEGIKDELRKLKDSGRLMMWYLSNISDRLDKVEFRLMLENEICRVNTDAFGAYKNRFRGKKVVVVGSGPTAKYYKPIPDAIHIGMNRTWLQEAITFDYLFTNDPNNTPNSPPIYDGFSKITDRVFVGTNTQVSDLWPMDITLKSDNAVRFFINVYARNQLIFPDIRCHPLSSFQSIFSAALEFALFTHPESIYIVGCDASRGGHFYYFNEKDASQFNPYLNSLRVGWSRMKLFASKCYPDVKITSINPVGLKGLFKDIYTDEYKASLQSE